MTLKRGGFCGRLVSVGLVRVTQVWGNSAFLYICQVMEDKPGVKRHGLPAAYIAATLAITVFVYPT